MEDLNFSFDCMHLISFLFHVDFFFLNGILLSMWLPREKELKFDHGSSAFSVLFWFLRNFNSSNEKKWLVVLSSA